MADLKVEKQALLSDANVWHQASGDLDEPAATIQPLTLNGADDVMGLGSRLGIDTTYERARTKMLQLIEQANGYFDDLAGALINVGEEYERAESDFAEKLDRLKHELEDES